MRAPRAAAPASLKQTLPHLHHRRRLKDVHGTENQSDRLPARASASSWRSRWYANSRNFAPMLAEDIKVRDFLKGEARARRPSAAC